MRFDFETKKYTENGDIRSDLVTIEAQKIARALKNDRLTKSQLRAFYGDVKAIENRMKNQDGDFCQENFQKNLYRVLMLKSKAAYRNKNGSSKLPDLFKDFIDKNVDLINKENNYESFEQFTIFFESVIGYCYGEGIGE